MRVNEIRTATQIAELMKRPQINVILLLGLKRLKTIILWSALLSSASTYADEIYTFDSGSGGWDVYPSHLGRSSEAGWVRVNHDGEGALRNSPRPTHHTYYWKLTRDVDLRDLTSATLELKYHFKGYQYDHFRVQVGDLGAKRPADFAVVHDVSEATATPEEVNLDLSAYVGRRVRVQLILRKPRGVIERRVGVYVHRVAVTTPSEVYDLEDRTRELRVAAFNVQGFGLSKVSHLTTLVTLTQVLSRFDLVVLQEVRDISETAITILLQELNTMSANSYAFHLSDRLGRAEAQEQAAFIYRVDKLSMIESGVTPDPDQLFTRSPAWARFEYTESGDRLWVLSAHLSAAHVVSELAALYEVFERYQRETPTSESAILMGDFKAGCTYLSEEEIALSALFNSSALSSVIDDESDTTTTESFCPYDRMLVSGPWIQNIEDRGVYRFEQALDISSKQAREVSDHYPIWVRFQLGQSAEESE